MLVNLQELLLNELSYLILTYIVNTVLVCLLSFRRVQNVL